MIPDPHADRVAEALALEHTDKHGPTDGEQPPEPVRWNDDDHR